MIKDQFTCRRGKARLRLLGADGLPVAGQTVEAAQIRHSFLFGCGGFDAVEYAGTEADGQPLEAARAALLKERLERIFSLCNYATLPFYWGRYEAVEGRPDQARTLAAARWLRERGVTLKGHPLCWHTVCADWLLQYDTAEILRKQTARIRRETAAFAGLIDMWDVINEVVIMPVFDKYDNAMTRLCRGLGQVRLVQEVFQAAHQTNRGATLLINDFNLGPAYEALLDDCLNAGVPIGAIGLQTHQHQGYMGLTRLADIVERYSRFGLPLHFTENTLLSGHLMPSTIVDLNDYHADTWPSTPEGEERQAREAVEMYEYLFSQPAVAALTTWDDVDGKWLGAPSGLLRADNSPKPIYTALKERIRGAWLTRTTFRTDEHGAAEFEGFLGDYTLSWPGGRTPFTLTKSSAETLLQLPPAPEAACQAGSENR